MFHAIFKVPFCDSASIDSRSDRRSSIKHRADMRKILMQRKAQRQRGVVKADALL